MRHILFLGPLVLATTLGCGSGSDKPVIPTALKPAPGMDSEGGNKGVKPKDAKPPDAKKQASETG
jgi:hypothetical protein